MPLDFESRPWFRSLGQRVGRETALQWVVLLFRDLGYAAEMGKLGEMSVEVGEGLRAAGVDLSALEGVGLVRKINGCVGGWECELYRRLNPELDGEYVGTAQMGGYARSVRLRMKSAAQEALTESGSLQGDLFAGVGAERVNRVMMLVKCCDHVYGRAARKKLEWTEGLVADAKRALERVSEEAVERTLTWILSRRKGDRMAGVPASTEELLRDFEKYVQE